jgi:SAM-dependent methyltransferase
MESGDEGRRLAAQARASPAGRRLLAAGLAAGHRALDVGCGSGGVTEELVALVGSGGHVTGLDPSAPRLDEARARLARFPNVALRQAALPATGVDGGAFDFVWSQFVFQYLPDPRPALDELVRLAKPGGRVAVAEIDGQGLALWPAPQVVLDGVVVFERGLRKRGFDLFVGRKLFQAFRRAGLSNVGVDVSPFYVVAGAADERLMADWRLRFDTLAAAVAPEFGSDAAYREFTTAYLEVLASADALKYSVVVTTWGTKE